MCHKRTMGGKRTGISEKEIERYRVIFEEIDSQMETPGSFALKLSMRLRTPITRVNHIIRNLPYPIKSGLTISQANKLSTVLEELGGKASVTVYISHSEWGESDRGMQKSGTGIEGSRQDEVIGVESDLLEDRSRRLTCPKCGWENEASSEYCSFCYETFHSKELNLSELSMRIPETNPLAAEEENSVKTRGIVESIGKYWYITAIGLFLLLLLLIFFKS